jgi:hypothetical protein
LLYTEEGKLQFGGYSDTVHRTYQYLFPDPQSPHIAQVRFEDGRAFHDLNLASGEHTAHHDCSPDIYEGQFQVQSQDIWQSRWIITGPHKDLCITTNFKKA